jgi:DNA-binding response OmpR family regulator
VKILVVDDDRELADLVAYALRQAGLFPIAAADGPSALRLVAAEQPDLVILDVNLPGLDGFEVLRRLRGAGERVPVLMLTVRAGEDDVVRGLDLGADDYLAKPFSPRTLLARVRALLRRAGESSPAAPLRHGDLSLDVESATVQVGTALPIRLTPLELRLLQRLLAQPGQPVAAERLIAHVWGSGEGDRQSLKQLVHRLRLKIEDDASSPLRLLSDPGFGYRLAGGEPS